MSIAGVLWYLDAVPIYEYQCKKCGHVLEQMHGMSEPPPRKTCPECKGKLERLISAAGFILKGGGWYKDLYSSPKPEGGGSKEKAEAPAKAEKSEAPAKADAKPKAKKAESK